MRLEVRREVWAVLAAWPGCERQGCAVDRGKDGSKGKERRGCLGKGGWVGQLVLDVVGRTQDRWRSGSRWRRKGPSDHRLQGLARWD